MSLEFNGRYPYKRMAEGDLRHREKTGEDKGRDWSYASTAKVHLQPLEARRDKGGFFPRGFEGSAALPVP